MPSRSWLRFFAFIRWTEPTTVSTTSNRNEMASMRVESSFFVSSVNCFMGSKTPALIYASVGVLPCLKRRYHDLLIIHIRLTIQSTPWCCRLFGHLVYLNVQWQGTLSLMSDSYHTADVSMVLSYPKHRPHDLLITHRRLTRAVISSISSLERFS